MSKKLIVVLTLMLFVLSGCTNTYLNSDVSSDADTSVTSENLIDETKIEITPDNAKSAEIDESAWYLTLVNYEYALPDDFTVELTQIANGISVDSRIIDAYNEMYDAAKADGVILNPCSGYRSIEYQRGLFTRRVAEYMNYGYNQQDSEKIVATYTARPGRSEHNLGLAIDFYDATTALTADFENTTQGKWLNKNSYKYGFIMRYSSDKTDITAIIYEPWHFRYVGKDDAKKIYESGLCLEEYLGKAGHADIDISGLTTTKPKATTTTQRRATTTTFNRVTTTSQYTTTTTTQPTTTTTTSSTSATKKYITSIVPKKTTTTKKYVTSIVPKKTTTTTEVVENTEN